MKSQNTPISQQTWPVLLLVMSGVFLTTMDSGMVNVALPTIMRDLALNLREVESVVTVYLLTITATLVFWGKFSHRVGRGRTYLGGMTLFGLGGIACYSSTSYDFLLISRLLQASGGAMMMATGPAIIRATFPKNKLGSGLGMVGIATACGLLVGPFIGGILIDVSSWRALFLAGLPVAVIGTSLGYIFLRFRLGQKGEQSPLPHDWGGSFLWSLIVLLGVGLLRAFDTISWYLTAGGIGLLLGLVVLFSLHERRSANPILPVQEMTERFYWVAVLTAGLSFGVLFTVLVLLPFYLEYVIHLTVPQVGRVMMAVPGTLLILSPLSGRLYDRMGARLLTTLGLTLSAGALFSFTTLSETSSIPSILLRLLILGAGQSVFLSPNNASVLSRIEDSLAGVTSGILATARNFGMVVGASSAMGMLAFWYKQISGTTLFISTTGAPLQIEFLMEALRATFFIIFAIAIISALISASRKY